MFFSFLHRGAVCADSTDFDRCVKLWLHAMQLKEKQSSSNSMTKDVLRFAQVFCQMIHLGVDIGNNYAFLKNRNDCVIFNFTYDLSWG